MAMVVGSLVVLIALAFLSDLDLLPGQQRRKGQR